MPEEPKNTYRYRVLRYAPNPIRGEWVNVGLLLEETAESATGACRRVFRAVEEQSEIARVRKLHPAVDESVLRGLPQEFDFLLNAAPADVAASLKKLDFNLSNAYQLSPPTAVYGDDFDVEFDRLYRAIVALPHWSRVGVVESTRA